MRSRALIVLLLAIVFTPRVPAQPGSATFSIRGVRVFDGERTADDRTVIVTDGLIKTVTSSAAEVPRNTPVIDGGDVRCCLD